MSQIIDLGGAPANEDCAQLGQTIGFDDANMLEVMTYRSAIIARHGMPPDGCRLIVQTNHPDFGSYRTLALRIDDDESAAVDGYAEAIEAGPGSWIESGFTAPVTYDGKVATIERRDHAELVIGALLTTRPDEDGTFPVADFAALHGNLAAAYPDQAAAAAARERLTDR